MDKIEYRDKTGVEVVATGFGEILVNLVEVLMGTPKQRPRQLEIVEIKPKKQITAKKW